MWVHAERGGLNGRRRSRVGPRLLLLVRADGFRRAVDDSAEHLGVPGARLVLTASPDIAASSDEGQRDNDDEDGQKTGAEAGPMEIDEG